MEKKFELNLNRRNVSKDELIADLKQVADLIGKASVTRSIYVQKGKFGASTLESRFGSWNKALEAAGLKVAHVLNIENDLLFENLANIWQHLGRQPLYRDLEKTNSGSKYSVHTYENRFGSWNKALAAFIVYINGSAEQKDALIDSQKDKVKQDRASRTPRNINWRLRATVLIKDNCICRMCGASPAKDSAVVLHVDHIKPWSKGGETGLENLQTLCSVCNIGKSDEIF